MRNVISNSFSVSAQKPTVSVDHIDNYYIVEATGVQPAVDDSRWQLVPAGGTIPMPTPAAPYLWHKTVTWLTDGTHLAPVVEFAGSMGQNGIDYDLVPSHSSILKDANDNLSPANVTCALVKRNADGSADAQSSIPTGYSIKVQKDNNTASNYTLGSNVSTSNCSVIVFSLWYGSVEIERHTISVVVEGAQGVDGRGIQSQDYRFKANDTGVMPAAPTSEAEWNTWKALNATGYSENVPYCWRCCKTVYVDGHGNTETVFLVDGPTVWGKSGKDIYLLDLDNEMTSIPISQEGKVVSQIQLSFNIGAYYGQTNVINDSACSVALVGTAPSGFTVDTATSKSNPRITIAANTQPAEITELKFRVSHTSYGDRDAVFSIAAVKSGGQGQDAVLYELLPSDTQIAVARTDAGGYNPSTVNLTCGYIKKAGTSAPTTVTDATGAVDGYSIYFRRYSRSGSWSSFFNYVSYKSYLQNLDVATYSKVQFILCRNTGSYFTNESSITGLIDKETVPIVADGTKGKDGKDCFVLDIDNEMAAIPVNSSGKVEGTLSLDFGLTAFYGTTAVTGDCSISVDGTLPSGFTVDLGTPTNPSVSIANNTQPAEVTEITFKAVHATYGTRYAVFTICAVKSGGKGADAELYQLAPSESALKFARNSAGNLTGSYTVSCKIRKTVGSNATEYTSLSGYYLYYGWDSAANPDGNWTGFVTVGTTQANSHTNLVLELWRGQRTVSGSVRLDRETIPILKDGEKGGEGDQGNGIANVYFYRMFTVNLVEPASNDSGWILKGNSNYPTEEGLSNENHYLWEKKLTSYTRSDDPTIEISLIAQYVDGVHENLLEDTAFLSEGEMEAWDVSNGTISKNAVGNHNSFYCTPNWEDNYTEMLRQVVYKSGTIQKLKPSTWYTLSFYAAMTNYFDLLSSEVYNGSDTNYWNISGSKKCFWIAAGSTAIVTVKGKVYSTAVRLVVFGYADGWESGFTKQVQFTSTGYQEKSFTLVNTSSSAKKFWVEGYVYINDGGDTHNSSSALSNRGYMNLIRVDRGCKITSYLYRSDNGQAVLHSSSAPWYVNGKKITSAQTLSDGNTGHVVSLDGGGTANVHDGTYVGFADDGNVTWQLSPGTKRCVITFKTPSNLYTSPYYRVLFRLEQHANPGWICMPKLEEGTAATDWIEAPNDRIAEEIQHVYVGPWTSGNTYYYGGGTGVRHVVRAPKSYGGAYTYWRMKVRTTSAGYVSTSQPYNDTSHWEQADYLKFVAAEFLLAEEIVVDKLIPTQIRSANNTFTIDANGNITCNAGTFQNVLVKGGLRSPFSFLSRGSTFSNDFSDNIAVYSASQSSYALPWTVAQSGRKVVITNYYWNGNYSTASGYAQLTAPSGYYFYEDGIQKSSIKLSREAVELLGYGDTNTFYGWIVLKRIDLGTQNRYGHQMKMLAVGRVTGTASDASVSYHSFDGTTMSVTRDGQGIYTLSWSNSNWFGSANDVFAMVCGYGVIVNGTNPLYASVKSQTSTSITVQTADDDSRNDGSFSFFIMNFNDWIYL